MGRVDGLSSLVGIALCSGLSAKPDCEERVHVIGVLFTFQEFVCPPKVTGEIVTIASSLPELRPGIISV